MVTDYPNSTTLNLITNKIKSKESCASSIRTWQNFFGKIVILTHICFDVITLGDIEYLSKTKDYGDKLVVVINSDESLKNIHKKISADFQNEKTRATLLASMHFIDEVVVFNESTPSDLIAFLQPNVLVQSTYYDANETNPESTTFISGSNSIRENGGKVITIDLFDDSSITTIREKIKSNCHQFSVLS